MVELVAAEQIVGREPREHVSQHALLKYADATARPRQLNRSASILFMLWIIATIVIVLIVLVAIATLWNRVRSSANFNLIYTRALRFEGTKEAAIVAALEHLRTFLVPFNELSDAQIATVAKLFCDIEEPHKALQPVLQQAERSKSLSPYFEIEALNGWKQTWLANQ